ncbi:ABC transporter permease subunit [Desulfohalovibrio reitneri]|uniref:ABC transporter permease subunit n=1 Tax=Desulfohalovibrio reitneri TaxID=1307759 RepID=UPI0004A74433|nr:branched-chain amino acid ABC transporter permease [Desulfohalovibrio reitneri]
MTLGSKRSWLLFLLGLGWFFVLLWPLLGIHPDGSLTFAETFEVWGYVSSVAVAVMLVYQLNKSGALEFVTTPLERVREKGARVYAMAPRWLWLAVLIGFALSYPMWTERYAQDVAVNVLIYICLGLGLNIVIGLCGLLDLGYIAFYGVGAYTYALLSVHFAIPFWLSLPVAAVLAAIAGCIIGYPTLRMRGDYLAIVTLGFGEIIRILLNNWMSLTNGPNGILGINAPGIWLPDFADGFTLEHLWLKQLDHIYYVILALAIFTIIAVRRLNFSRIGRAWEAIREDETAAELMGVNTFTLKLMAYASGAVFGGLAGAFFSARMRFVSPESFTFLESALVLAMVVLGGLGSIPGVILGALALIALPEIFREFELYRMLAFGGAMTLMMVVRPAGLIPAKRMGKRGEEAE